MKKHLFLKRLLVMCLMLMTTMLVPICALAQGDSENRKIRYTASERLEDYDEGNYTPCGMVDSHEFNDGSGCITFSDPVTSIGNDAFSGCDNLTYITIPASVTSIGEHAFHYCENLTSITLPEGLTSIGYDAFSECSSLTSIILPLSLTSIGDFAFHYCENLTSITLPEGVTSIGYDAFLGCDNLVYCNILSSQIENVGDIAIRDDAYLIVPADRKDDYQNLFGKDDDHIFCNDRVITYTTNDGRILSHEGRNISGDYWNVNSKNYGLILFDGPVTSIGDGAFIWCDNLTSITIPEGVTSIGDWAFTWCDNLTSITLPASVTSIGDCAFSWCDNLQSVIFSGFNGEGYDLVLKYDSNNDTYSAGALTIDDSKPLQIPVNFTAKSVTYIRSVTSGQTYTFMLPYAVTGEQMGGTIYELSGYADSKVSFAKVEGETSPNQPYLFVPEGTEMDGSRTDDVEISKTAGAELSTTQGDLKMIGSYTPQTVLASEGNYYGFYQQSFVKVGSKANLNPYRAMLQLTSDSGAAPSRLTMTIEQEATSVTTLDEEYDSQSLPLYDLYGRRISAPTPGSIYVKGVKK